MPFDREIWSRAFQQFPQFPCPRCSGGRLNVLSDTERRMQPNWSFDCDDPELLVFERFSVLLLCSRPSCGEVVSVIGTYRNTGGIIVELDSGATSPELVYEPTAMSPAPPIIRLPRSIPDEVERAVKVAFHLYWGDLEACLSKVRASVEKLLDHHQVPRERVNGSFMPLKERLDALSSAKADLTWLNALRVIGNLGTHGDVTEEDVMNAMEIYEIVLDYEFGTDPRTRADDLAKLLNPKGI